MFFLSFIVSSFVINRSSCATVSMLPGSLTVSSFSRLPIILLFLSLFFKLASLLFRAFSLSLSLTLTHFLSLSRFLLLSRDYIVAHYYQIIGFQNCILSRALSFSLQNKGTNWRKSRPNCIIFSFIYYGWNFVSQYNYFSLFPLFPYHRPMGLTAVSAR